MATARIASGSASSAPRGDRASATPARTTPSSTNATGLAASTSTVSRANGQSRPVCSAHRARSGERHPEREGERAGEDDAGPHDCERADRPTGIGAPFTRRDDAERERRGRNAQNREQLDSDQCRERVVEQAVGDEAVAPRVPEVVPDPEAAILEDAALVEVSGEIAAGGPNQARAAASVAATPAANTISRGIARSE